MFFHQSGCLHLAVFFSRNAALEAEKARQDVDKNAGHSPSRSILDQDGKDTASNEQVRAKCLSHRSLDIRFDFVAEVLLQLRIVI